LLCSCGLSWWLLVVMFLVRCWATVVCGAVVLVIGGFCLLSVGCWGVGLFGRWVVHRGCFWLFALIFRGRRPRLGRLWAVLGCCWLLFGALGAILGRLSALLAALGLLLAALGPLLAFLGPLLGRPWPLLSSSWPLLGPSWQLLGCSWAALDRSWASKLWLKPCKNVMFREYNGLALWGCFFAPLGDCLGLLGRSWLAINASCCLLARSWALLAGSWIALGGSGSDLGARLGGPGGQGRGPGGQVVGNAGQGCGPEFSVLPPLSE